MIAARKSAGFDRIFRLYNDRYLLRRQFQSFAMSGHGLDVIPAGQPAIYIMNHSSWWDGLLLYHAFRQTSHADHYVMMEERQLKRYAFFGKLGAFSIDKSSPGDIRQSMRYGGQLLQNGGRVWIFPQGEMKHLDTRPLGFRPGIHLLLRQAPVHTPVIPVTLYYGLFQHARLQVSLHVGEPLREDWQNLRSAECSALLEEHLTSQLNWHRDQMIRQDGNMADERNLIPPRRSTDDRYDQYRQWRKR
ncbi:lysophospholipid acyltransferase family protein [Paenibacillus sp. WLX2291]|uniref:lysophospholipid acyltransferase family protein n=1 Tax=Paenibacillus sp. WLX2291 TaxID=3296934 RepID=UPI003983FB55